MPADFISRNPNIAAGRDAFIQVLRTNPTLLQNHRQRVPEVEFAKNDYVFLMWANFIINPMEPAKIYKFNTLDLFRIADGKIVEHRDGAHKSAEGDFGAKGQGGGVYNSSTKLTPKEQETRRLGMVEFKDILQDGHTELALQAMAPGYMQHNVNVPGGRDNFNQELQQPAEEADRGQVGDTADARAHYRQLLPEVRPAPRAPIRPTKPGRRCSTASTWFAWTMGCDQIPAFALASYHDTQRDRQLSAASKGSCNLP